MEVVNKANYSAGAGQTIAGALGRGGDGKFTRVGSSDAAKARKLIQDLARKQQQKQATKKPAKGKRAAAKKPAAKKGAAPKKTDAQKEQERQAKLAQRQAEREQRRKEAEDKKQQERRENDKKVAEQAGLGTDTHDALTEFASPDEKIQLAPSMAADLEKRGLVEKDSTGEYRMTAQGRQYVRAAESGDVRAAADAISEGSDNVVKNQQRATEKQARDDARAKRKQEVEARRAEREKKKQNKGGGGKSKPSEADKQAQRERQRATNRQAFAPQAGIDSADAEALAQSATQPGTPNERLIAAGLQNAQGEATDQGRRFLNAVERGDLRGAQAALQDARQRQERDTSRNDRQQRISQRRQRRSIRRVKAQTASERAMFAKMGGGGSGGGGGSKGGGALWKRGANGKRVPNRTQAKAVLSSPNVSKRTLRRALDDAKPGAGHAPTFDLSTSDWRDIAKSHFNRGTATSIAKAKFIANNLRGASGLKFISDADLTGNRNNRFARKSSVDETATLSVFKAQNGQWRWIIRSGSAFLDRDREIFSRKALIEAVERNRARGYYGPLRWWHCGEIDTVARKAGPGLDIGDCDFSGMMGRTLVESGTFREERYARAAQEHATTLKASLGVVYKPLDISADGVYDRLDIVERSLCPADKARNQLSGSLHVFQR